MTLLTCHCVAYNDSISGYPVLGLISYSCCCQSAKPTPLDRGCQIVNHIPDPVTMATNYVQRLPMVMNEPNERHSGYGCLEIGLNFFAFDMSQMKDT